MVKTIAEAMKQYGQVEITNKTKIVMIKGLDGETYKIDLIRQRQPKKQGALIKQVWIRDNAIIRILSK